MYSDEVDNGIWLFDVLNNIWVNDVYRKVRQQQGIMGEILESFQDPITTLNMGSTFEGTDSPGEPSDMDVMRCDESFSVIENMANATEKDGILSTLLIVRELHTPPGYVKLQLVNGETLYTSKHWTILSRKRNMNVFKIDREERIVLSDHLLSGNPEVFKRTKNKPADVTVGKFANLRTDIVFSYRCKSWPTIANEWLYRYRLYGWPSKESIEELKSLGFFVVRKGHPFSPENDLEWRISLSLQERQLMFNLTDVQHKCYVVLKMLNRDVINFDCITTYHWKTCLFYAIEENNGNIWEKNFLWYCIKLCIRKMVKWIKCGFCPNYFIPGENLFDGRLNNNLRLKSEKCLNEILNVGFDSLLSVRKNKICDFVRSRGSLECFQRLHANSTAVLEIALRNSRTCIIQDAMSFFNHGILEHYSFKADYNTLNFIRSIWLTLDGIQHTSANIISGHTERDTQNSLSLLLPSIYTCLASNISAVAIQNPNPQIRYFLLLGSFVYFMKGKLPGRLKFISVLYAAELYNDCEWWIDQLDEEYIKYNPSLCKCRYILIDQKLAITDIIKTSPLEVSNCVSFLPTEILIAPDAIKYEIFRYVGIFLNEQEKNDKFGRWQYRAVVDSNIYFFSLKYLTKRKLERVQAREDAKHNIRILVEGLNVRPRDVVFNVLAWIFHSDFDTYTALSYATESWRAMLSAGISHAMSEDTLKMKSKQYQYNAAKIHALVIIYKTWFARIPSDVFFCFQCFCKSDIKLKKCSRCKVSTYCDKQCQRKNWKIHKKTCKMARKHHILFSTSVIPFTFNERIS